MTDVIFGGVKVVEDEFVPYPVPLEENGRTTIYAPPKAVAELREAVRRGTNAVYAWAVKWDAIRKESRKREQMEAQARRQP